MNSSFRKGILISIGPTLAVILWTFFDLDPGNRQVTWMAGIAAWMAWWWLSESVHFAITACLPLLALPALDIAGFFPVLSEYADRIIFVFLGGFIIALGLEKWNLHRRFALFILSRSGTSAAGVLAGVLITTFLISMWISNTATVLMLLPAILALAKESSSSFSSEKNIADFFKALLLGLAYAASIGGMATLVGTPTNMIFYGKVLDTFGPDSGITFGSWFIYAAPLAFLMLTVCFVILYILFLRKCGGERIDRKRFREEHKALGKWKFEEKAMGVVFLILAGAWFSRADLDLGYLRLQGWGDLIPQEYAYWRHDFLPAVLMALALLLIPSRSGAPLLTIPELKRIPFDVIILFGGGFALALGIEKSGMSSWMSSGLSGLGHLDPVLFVILMCMVVCCISEFASNVACIQLMIPLLMAFHPSLHVHALFLLVPATLASSLGFMLPVATAPNTIVFSTRKLKTGDMLRAGFFLDVAGILLIGLFVWLFGTVGN